MKTMKKNDSTKGVNWPFPTNKPQTAAWDIAPIPNHPYPVEEKSKKELSPALAFAAERGITHMRQEKSAIKNLEDSARKELIKKAVTLGVHVCHVFDKDFTSGGLTVAFRKVSPYDSGIMVECAVQTCSTNDTFSKKVGTKGALERFFNGETIQLPLLLNTSERFMSDIVKHAFNKLYNAI